MVWKSVVFADGRPGYGHLEMKLHRCSCLSLADAVRNAGAVTTASAAWYCSSMLAAFMLG
jgi:hypothetical protein